MGRSLRGGFRRPLFVRLQRDVLRRTPLQECSATVRLFDINASAAGNKLFVFDQRDGSTEDLLSPNGDEQPLRISTHPPALDAKDFELPEEIIRTTRPRPTATPRSPSTIGRRSKPSPVFQSDGNLSIPENQTFVFDFNATDLDGDTFTYSLAYGDDHLLFDINASTGILTFLTPKDFESPEDNNRTTAMRPRSRSQTETLRYHSTCSSTGTDAVGKHPQPGPRIPIGREPVHSGKPKATASSTSTRPIRTETPSPILLLTATTRTLKSSRPPGCLHSSPLPTSSRPRTIIPTTCYEATIQVSDGNTSVSSTCSCR